MFSTTVDTLIASKGRMSVQEIVQNGDINRRQLERKFAKKVGISPKQLGKVIRLQTALDLLMAPERESLTQVAYKADYFDQAHFIKDFKEFTGTNPKNFLTDKQLELSALFLRQRLVSHFYNFLVHVLGYVCAKYM